MRDRFIAPIFAAAAFAVTLGAAAWENPQPAPEVTQSGSPDRQVPSLQSQSQRLPAADEAPQSQATSLAAQPEGSATEVRAGVEPVAAEVAAPPPMLPDASALPDYEEQQAATNSGGLRNARAR